MVDRCLSDFRGAAKADAYRAGVQALGPQGYTAVQLMQIIGDQKVRIIPDITVSGAQGGSTLAEAMLGMLLRGQVAGNGGASGATPTPGK
jgi:uncharacterized membrane protein YqiK